MKLPVCTQFYLLYKSVWRPERWKRHVRKRKLVFKSRFEENFSSKIMSPCLFVLGVVYDDALDTMHYPLYMLHLTSPDIDTNFYFSIEKLLFLPSAGVRSKESCFGVKKNPRLTICCCCFQRYNLLSPLCSLQCQMCGKSEKMPPLHFANVTRSPIIWIE